MLQALVMQAVIAIASRLATKVVDQLVVKLDADLDAGLLPEPLKPFAGDIKSALAKVKTEIESLITSSLKNPTSAASPAATA